MTAACVSCGFDPSAAVLATWTFDVPHEIGSLNQRVFNGRMGWKYRKDRDQWAEDFTVFAAFLRIPAAKGKRRVTLTRLYSGQQKEMDRRNMDFKACLDAMKIAGLILDDKPALLEDIYRQERGKVRGVRVLIEEVL